MQIAQSYLHAKLQRPSEGRNNWIRGVKGNFTHNLNTIIDTQTLYRTVSYFARKIRTSGKTTRTY